MIAEHVVLASGGLLVTPGPLSLRGPVSAFFFSAVPRRSFLFRPRAQMPELQARTPFRLRDFHRDRKSVV